MGLKHFGLYSPNWTYKKFELYKPNWVHSHTLCLYANVLLSCGVVGGLHNMNYVRTKVELYNPKCPRNTTYRIFMFLTRF